MNNENESEKEKEKDYKNFELLYSPRTNYAKELEFEQQLFNDLTLNFDPITIKIIKKHFKERLGSLKKIEFVTILKNHLLSWHPELPNREELLIKLLSRLFKDIDLNCNNEMNWDEFTDYLMNTSKNVSKEKLNYDLRLYKHSNNTIDDLYFNDLISYAFYIEKYNIIGIVIENKSIINFYDANNCKRVRASIDVKKTQRDIDQMQMKEFDIKARERIQKQKEENKKKLLKQQENLLKRNNISIKENLLLNNYTKKKPKELKLQKN